MRARTKTTVALHEGTVFINDCNDRGDVPEPCEV